MNKELLQTPVVKSQINYYLKNKLTVDDIRLKLEDTHLIIISVEELNEFIKLNNIVGN